MICSEACLVLDSHGKEVLEEFLKRGGNIIDDMCAKYRNTVTLDGSPYYCLRWEHNKWPYLNEEMIDILYNRCEENFYCIVIYSFDNIKEIGTMAYGNEICNMDYYLEYNHIPLHRAYYNKATFFLSNKCLDMLRKKHNLGNGIAYRDIPRALLAEDFDNALCRVFTKDNWGVVVVLTEVNEVDLLKDGNFEDAKRFYEYLEGIPESEYFCYSEGMKRAMTQDGVYCMHDVKGGMFEC